MELRRDLLLGVGSLVALNLLIALLTIAVLTRMGPVIDRILRENVYSVQAAEEMLATLAVAGDRQFDAEQSARYTAALARARANVTESMERAPLVRLTELQEEVFSGAGHARRESVGSIQSLTGINYRVMRQADEEARRLSLAGAWFSVFVAGFALTLSIVVVRRLTQRLIAPIRELWTTLEATRAGDQFRRCSITEAPAEMGRIITRVNEMLDMRSRPRPWSDRRAQADHAVMLWSIRRYPEPTYAVDEGGQIFGANGPGHALLGEPRGREVRDALGAAIKGPSSLVLPSGLRMAVEHVPEGPAWICRILDAATQTYAPDSVAVPVRVEQNG